MENPSRAFMPDEYRFTGVSMNSPTPANSMISESPGCDLRPAHAHHGALEKDVLASGEVRMKAGGDFDERADAPADHALTLGRAKDLRQQFQRRRLAGAVRADDAKRRALADLEAHITQRPELGRGVHVLRWRSPGHTTQCRRNQIAQGVVPLPATELLPDVVERDWRGAHFRRSPRTRTLSGETAPSSAQRSGSRSPSSAGTALAPGTHPAAVSLDTHR